MVRIRSLELAGFRGCRFPMAIDLTPNGKSIAIFGENASGKSSITDAIEWVIFDRIAHLWREDCKESALRHVRLVDGDDAVVMLTFNEPDLTICKTLRTDLTTTTVCKTKIVKPYVEQARSERLILRAADMTSFVSKTKTEKRQEVANIVGYDDVLAFRNTIQSTLNALRKDEAYTTAKSLADTRHAKLLILAGRTLTTEPELYEVVNELISPHALKVSVEDEQSCDAAIATLTSRFSQQEKAQRKLALDQSRGAAEELIGALDKTVNPEEAFYAAYGRTLESKEKIQKLAIEEFLQKGKSVVDSHLCEPGKCPLCGTPFDLTVLSQQLEHRITEFDVVRKEFEAVRSLKTTYSNSLGETATALSALNKCLTEPDSPLGSEVKRVGAVLEEYRRDICDSFERFELPSHHKQFRAVADTMRKTLLTHAREAHEAAKALELSQSEKQIIDLITKIRDLRSTFKEYSSNSTLRHCFEVQITSLQTIFTAFVSVQSAALQTVLDLVSCNVGKYYSILHPDESVDRVCLRIAGEEGIEFEYYFHGEPTSPPMKYLSESHLNSLGIALFLASVKLFNRRSGFFVLDDVITSLDMGHRRRLIRLFADHFSDWQIILLTHESFWFDLIKRELAPCGWQIAEVWCDPENGSQVKASPKDLWELIETKRKKHLPVANDARILMERVLKQLCEVLEVKVAFRYNEINEHRMSQELLSELRSTLNKKCGTLKDQPVLARLEASVLVTNVGSHDRPDVISDGDIAVALNDLKELQNLFGCPDCFTFVRARQTVPGEQKIACRCGKTAIPWKS